MSSIPRKPINKKVRDLVIGRFSGRCGYCGEIPNLLQIDHISPCADRRIEFVNDINNLMPACAQCNNFKGVMNLEEFRKSLKDNVRKAKDYSVNFRFALKFGQVEVSEKDIIFYFEKDNEGAL